MGVLRFLLAVFVMASHASFIGFPLPEGSEYGQWSLYGLDGRQAVAIFFVISGFYMAMVLNTKYDTSIWRFYANRFLRLWPTYAISVVLVLLFLPNKGLITTMTSQTSVWFQAYVWFSNIFILGSDLFYLLFIDVSRGVVKLAPIWEKIDANGFHLYLNAPVFSIGMEMTFYLMAPFILRSVRRVWVYFAIGFAYYAYFLLAGQFNLLHQYHLFPSSFLYFAMGALSWHYYYRGKEYRKIPFWGILALVVMLQFAYTIIAPIIVIAFAFLTPHLFELTKHDKWDRILGELSYPIYIFHYPVIQYLYQFQLEPAYFGSAVLGATLLLAIPVRLLVEKPIDAFRQRLAAAKSGGLEVERASALLK